MKVYTFLTESHKIFLNQFISTFPFEDGLDLEIKFLPQECDSGSYHSKGWGRTMKRKVEYIIDALNNTKDDSFMIHSDIDIQFFGKIKSDLETIMNKENKDIFFQNDGHQVCMGFFICKKNKNILNLFTNVLNDLENHMDDQFAVNHFLRKNDINYGILPERYFTIGIRNSLWSGEDIKFNIPDNIIMHHANFTVGIENKINLLKKIKTQING